MKLASSMRYAGMLVAPDDCDYSSYIRLGLTCPVCKSPVFLVSAGYREAGTRKLKERDGRPERTIQVKEAEIPAHFSHFKDVSQSDIEKCELRVSQFKPQEIQKRAYEAKRQREQVFKRHFWRLLRLSYKMYGCDEDIAFAKTGFKQACPAKDPNNFREVKWQKFINLLSSHFASRQGFMEGVITDTLDSIAEDTKAVGDRWLVNFDPLTAKALQTWSAGLEARMQAEIAKEALGFLCNKRNQGIVADLLAISLASYVLHADPDAYANGILNSNLIGVEDRLYADISMLAGKFRSIQIARPQELAEIQGWLYTNIAVILATVPWADGFEQLEKNQEIQEAAIAENVISKGIWHYTLNTGHMAFQPFSKDSGLAAAWGELYQEDSRTYPIPEPFQEFSMKITIEKGKGGCALFDIGRGEDPSADENRIVTCAAVWTPEGDRELRPLLKMLHNVWSTWHQQRDIPFADFNLPTKLPYLAVLVIPNPNIPHQSWVADAERTIAQALIMESFRKPLQRKTVVEI